MKYINISCLVALLIFALPSTAFGLISDQQQISDQVALLLLTEDFKKLNELAHEYRIKKTRTADGSWKLNAFYLGIAQLADMHNQNELFWDMLENKTQRWIKRFPNSPAAHIAHAMVLSRRGWMLRWIDYPRIIPENWLSFFQYNKNALQQLEKHKAIASVDPNWYQEMAWVASSLGEDKTSILKILHQGIEQEPAFSHLQINALWRTIDSTFLEPQSAQTFTYATTDIIKKLDKFTAYLWIVLQPLLPKIQANIENLIRDTPAYFERWIYTACDTLNNSKTKEWFAKTDTRLNQIRYTINEIQCREYGYR